MSRLKIYRFTFSQSGHFNFQQLYQYSWRFWRLLQTRERQQEMREWWGGEKEVSRLFGEKKKVFYRASKMAAEQREEKNITFWQTNCSFWYTFQIPSQSEFIYFYSCVILAYSRLAIFFILILSTMSCLDMFWRSSCPDELFWILDFFLKIDFKF